MKKFLFFAIIISGLFFASCKKDRVCTCTYTGITGISVTGEVTYTKARKKDARSQCLSRKEVDGQGRTETWECKLK